MALMRRGLSNKQIADRLRISVNTAKKHVSNALEKRGLHKRRQAFDL
jgi:DNA-binding NarL/FixJ family response regulator